MNTYIHHYQSYLDTHEKLYAAISDPGEMARISLVNIAESGVFAADRAVREYAENIWGIDVK